MDSETTLQKLKDLVTEFRDARDWGEFNDPKSIAEALSIEASELLECFLWKDKAVVADRLENDAAFREHVGEELADVIVYALQFAHDTKIDIATAIDDKVKKNAIKYPVSVWKGKPSKQNIS